MGFTFFSVVLRNGETNDIIRYFVIFEWVIPFPFAQVFCMVMGFFSVSIITKY